MEFKMHELKKPNKKVIPMKYLDTREPEFLTDEYVSQINREIAYRIREKEDAQVQSLQDVNITRKLMR